MELIEFLGQNLADFWSYTGFANATPGHIVMLCVGLFFIWLAIKHDFEPPYCHALCGSVFHLACNQARL